MKQFRTMRALVAGIESDPELAEQMRTDPVKTLQQVTSPLRRDVWVYRIVVAALGTSVMLCICGAVTIALVGSDGPNTQQPEILISIGSGAVGALAGLLVPQPQDE
jgi:hypothetical protein